jgi:hypothetical protein
MTVPVKMECPGLSDKVIPAQFVRIHDANKGAPAPPVADCAPSEREEGEPGITLLKEGDAIKAIEITCTCGAVIRLDCEFSKS